MNGFSLHSLRHDIIDDDHLIIKRVMIIIIIKRG